MEEHEEALDLLPRPRFVRVAGGGPFTPGANLETELAALTREAAIVPATFDAERLEVDVRWSTGARVLRQDLFAEPFYEELSLADGEVRLERINAGAPLLDSHFRRPLEAQIGRVVPGSVRIENGVGLARVRLSARAELEGLRTDVRDGVVGNVSVGYTVFQWRDVTGDGQITVLRAVDWEPSELSLVAVPAEAGMSTRGRERPRTPKPCVILGARNLLRPMDPEEDPQTTPNTAARAEGSATPSTPTTAPDTGTTAEPAPAEGNRGEPAPSAPAAPPATPERSEPAPATATAAERAAIAERTRARTIRTLCTRHQLHSLADELVDSGCTVEAARTRVLDVLADQSAAGINPNHATTTTTRAERDKVHDAVLSSLRSRFGLREVTTTRNLHGGTEFRVADQPYAPLDEARDLQYASGIDLARVLLESEGVNCGHLSRDHVARLAFGNSVSVGNRNFHGTSAFPNLFANVQGNRLLMAYATAPRTFARISRQVNAQDFRLQQRTKLSGAPALELVAENGEIKRGTMVEEAETYKLLTYGKIIGFTRQALVNDQLQGLMDLAEKFGRSAALKESELFWDIVNSNQVLGDGVALFDAAHSNIIAAASPLSVDNLGAIRALLRRQTDPLGHRMNLNVYALVVPAELETKAQQFTSALVPDSAGNVNPFRSAFREVIAESHLTNVQQWYVTADPAVQPTFEWAYLEGAPGPQVSTRAGWDIDGMETRVQLDFAAAAMDHRGVARAAG